MNALRLYTTRAVIFVHTQRVSVVRCTPPLQTVSIKMRCWRTWCPRTVHHSCTICTSKALLCGKIAVTGNLCAQQCWRKYLRALHIACRKIAGSSNSTPQKCAKPAIGRVSSDTRTDARRLSHLIAHIGPVVRVMFLA